MVDLHWFRRGLHTIGESGALVDEVQMRPEEFERFSAALCASGMVVYGGDSRGGHLLVDDGHGHKVRVRPLGPTLPASPSPDRVRSRIRALCGSVTEEETNALIAQFCAEYDPEAATDTFIDAWLTMPRWQATRHATVWGKR